LGINTHYYTVYGVKINSYDKELSEEMYGDGDKYDIVKASADLDVIMDDMGGKYMIFGKILFDSGDLRWNEFKDTFVEINPTYLKSYKVKAMQEFKKLLPDFFHYLDGEWKLMTFMHLS